MVASAQGLDVSNFQSKFDWAGAKHVNPSLAFGICKITEGLTFTDSQAGWNWQQLHAAGLVRGAYHFGHPGDSATAQVDHFLGEATKLGLTTSDLLVLDLEVTDGHTPATVAAWGKMFMENLVQRRPHNPRLLYTFISFARDGNCDGLGGYPLWLAFPNSTAPKPPPPWTAWRFWQWGTRNGTDADAFNGSADKLHNWVASFGPAPTPPPIKPGLWTADGRTSLRVFAHRAGSSVLDVTVKTVTETKGNLGPGQQKLLGDLVNGNVSPDDIVPKGTQLYS